MTDAELEVEGPVEAQVEVEVADPHDAEAIAALLARNQAEPTLLLRPASDIAAEIAEFVLVRADAGLRACAQLRRHRDDVAELMSVAVDPDAQGRGLGSACVASLLDRARAEGVALVWLATTHPGFFAKHGFVAVPITRIPWAILLAKLPLVLRQPVRRWPAALLGAQIFMRWDPDR